MANAASLVNFGSGSGLEIGDWTYSTYLRSAPSYLPLNSSVTTYLAASYPALFALLPATNKIFPVSTTGTTAPNVFGSTPAYGNSIWVMAGGSASTYLTSTDGLVWTARTGYGSRYGVCFGNGIFVAWGTDNTGVTATVETSTDGITWTLRGTFPTTLFANKILWSGSLFVAVGASSTGGAVGTVAATSPDGITWTSRTIPSAAYYQLAYGGGLWVAASGVTGAFGVGATSPDGITWTARTTPLTSNGGGLVYGAGIFVLMASNSASYYTSVDGLSWTTRAWGSTRAISALVFGDSLFVLCNENVTSAMRYSSDAITWLDVTTTIKPLLIAPSVSGNFFYGSSSSAIPYRENFSVSTTTFFLPVVSPVTGTFTYVRAT